MPVEGTEPRPLSLLEELLDLVLPIVRFLRRASTRSMNNANSMITSGMINTNQ